MDTMPMTTDLTDPRWRAVAARDRRADGRFVVAVHSTRIYCRPSCPARHPKPQNVSFLASPEEARGRGYRACLRCKPDAAVADDAAMVSAVCAAIDADEDGSLKLKELGLQAGISVSHLQRVFKKLVGITPKQYAANRRLQRFKRRLRNGETVTAALYGSGFGSSSRLYTDSTTRLGMTPTALRRAGQGLDLRYTTVPTLLGRMLVACTPRGVAEVRFGDSERALTAQLRQDYHAAALTRDDDALRATVKKIVAHLDTGAPLRGIAADVHATAFEHKVWQALSAIPYGETKTYADIAASIGEPQAARAVGRACGANRLAVIIPCHRAVAKSPRAGGYRWGLERKRTLLERERLLAKNHVRPNGDAKHNGLRGR